MELDKQVLLAVKAFEHYVLRLKTALEQLKCGRIDKALALVGFAKTAFYNFRYYDANSKKNYNAEQKLRIENLYSEAEELMKKLNHLLLIKKQGLQNQLQNFKHEKHIINKFYSQKPESNSFEKSV